MLIPITIGRCRAETNWQPAEMEWEALAAELTTHKRSWATCAQYAEMDKDRRAQAKDGRAFVGGALTGPRRKKDAVAVRTLLTLDADDVEGKSAEDVAALVAAAFPGKEAVVYSSFSHEPGRPRLRIVLPLARKMLPEYYEPAARMAAKLIGIEMMDPSTYQAERCMYFPACCADADPFAWRQRGEFLDALDLLAPYGGRHTDPSLWPRAEKAAKAEGQAAHGGHGRAGSIAANPLEKGGIVGAFCRAHYPIDEGMADLLPGVYEPCPRLGKDRYTYAGGSTAGGAVAAPWTGRSGEPPTGKNALLYSHHASDPANGCCNIYDLVRLHLFGGDDDRMAEFAAQDAKTREILDAETGIDLEGLDLSIPESEDRAAKPRRRRARKSQGGGGDDLASIAAVVAAIGDNAKLSAAIGYDEFAGRLALRAPLPWREDAAGSVWTDYDESRLMMMMEERGANKAENVRHGLRVAADMRRFHPVREYLSALPAWDGVPRLERLIIDYLGADDTPLVREMSALFVAAMVARVMEPGIKYDYVLLLKGPQGSGKSSLGRVIGGPWFRDSVSLGDLKRATEQLQGALVLEFGELAGYSKQESENVKQFLSSQSDDFRPAYGRNVEVRKRQCVFFATTNNMHPLKGDEGNRRWVPVEIKPDLRKYPSVAAAMDALSADRDQIFAEALAIFCAKYKGRPLILSEECEALAREAQNANNEIFDDPLRAELERFLDIPLPFTWPATGLQARRDFFSDPDGSAEVAAREPRDKFTAAEFVQEYLRRDPGDREYRKLCRRVNATMQTIDGWEAKEMVNHVAHLYGRQRGFVRIGVVPDEPQLTIDDL